MSEKSISWSKVVKRAAKDSQFRQDLLANPRETLEKEYGIPLPKNVNFVVHEQTEDTVHLVLPPLKGTATSAQRYSDDDEEANPQRYSDDDEEANPQRYSDDDEEANPQRYSDDDEEANQLRYSDDDEEANQLRYSDDDEESAGSRYSDDDEELKS